MAIKVTPQIDIDKYFESEALSQSVLKSLLGGYDKFLSNLKEESELYYEEKGHFLIGSAVDCILTGHEEEFAKQYYVSQIEKKPSDVEMSIIKMAFDDIVNNYDDNSWFDRPINQFPGAIKASIEEHNWQPRWGEETRINKIMEVGSEYFEDLKLSFGKQILTVTQRILIDEIVGSLRKNPRTSKYFDRSQLALMTNIDVYYQLPIYFEYKGIQCKALLDLLIVIKDETGKVVALEPFDLKTMSGNTINFLSNLKSFRYDIQAAWYTEALTNENSSFVVNSGYDLSNVIVKPFTFIVESSTIPGKPLLYKVSEQLLSIGKNGRTPVYINDLGELFNNEPVKDDVYQPITVIREIRGFDSLIDEYIYYQNTEWKEEKVIAENDGVLKIGWDGIM